MSKATTENDRNIGTKIVAATFENEIGPEEISGKSFWRNQGYLDARRSNYSMEKVNFPENTFSKHTLNFDTGYFDFLKSELQFLGSEIRKSLKEALLDIALSFHCLMFTLKRLFMICYHSKYFVTAFFA